MRTEAPQLDASNAFEAHVLTLGLVAFGAVAVIASTLSVTTFGPYDTPFFITLAPIVAVTNLVLLAWRRGPLRLRSLVFVVCVLVWVVSGGVRYGWPPAYPLAMVFLTTIAGLLLGARATYLLVAVNVLGLSTAPLWLEPAPLPREILNPAQARNWLRVGLAYFIFTGAVLLTFQRVIRWLERAHTKADENLRRAEAESKASLEAQEARRALERDLRRAQRLNTVRRIASGLSALYGRTLMVVRAALEELERARTPEQARAAAEVLHAAARRVVGPTQEVLRFGRRKANGASALGVAELIGVMQHRLRDALREGIELAVETEGEAQVVLQTGRLEEVLLELILNAQEATAGRGHVKISVDEVAVTKAVPGLDLEPGSYVRVAVEDDGEGMTEDVLARAHEPFFSTRPSGRGHQGLGVTSAFAFARASGGTARVSSEPGQGTRVELFLSTDGAKGTREAPGPTLGGINIHWSRPPTLSAGRTRSRRPARWQVRALDGVWSWLSWVVCVGFAVSLFVSHESIQADTLVGLGLVITVLVLARTRSRLAYGVRVGVLVSAVAAIGFGFVLGHSYMAPAPVALVPLVALLLLLLLPPAYGWAAHLASGGFFAVAGLLHESGWINPPMEAYSTADPRNWLRVSLLLSLALLLFSRAVQGVLERARQEIRDLEASSRAVEAAVQARMQQTRELVLAERMQARAASMEVTGKLASAVAHDMNNALQVMLGWASEVKDVPEDDALRRDSLESLAQATQAAEALLLDLRPVLASRDEPRPSDLGVTVRRVSKLARAILPDQVQVEIDVSPGCFAPIDEAELRRALLNLVNNAGHAMPEGGALTIRVRDDADNVFLEVIDTGHGMDERTRARAFDDFFTTKGEGEGTGLGLGSARRAVQRSGGQITVDSAPDEGTRVALRWSRAAPTSGRSAERVVQSRLRGLRVLLADPDPIVARMMCRGLDRAGCAAVTVDVGVDPRTTLKEHPSWDAFCIDECMLWDWPDLLTDLYAACPDTPAFVFCADPESAPAGSSGQSVFPLTKPLSGADLHREVATRLPAPSDQALP